MNTLKYQNMFKEEHGAMVPGVLTFKPKRIVFTKTSDGSKDLIPASSIASLKWYTLIKGPAIRIVDTTDALYRYSGFPEEEKTSVSSYVKRNYDMVLLDKKLSKSGVTYGSLDIEGPVMDFTLKGNTSFEIPLESISNVDVKGKEMSIEFVDNKEDTQLCGMKFSIPKNKVETLHAAIVDKAKNISNKVILELEKLFFIRPKGVYDLKMYEEEIVLYNKSYTSHIQISNILKIFMLPHSNNISKTYVILSLRDSFKQGNTNHYYITFEIFNDVDTTIILNLPMVEITKRYGDTWTKRMQGKLLDLIRVIFARHFRKEFTQERKFEGSTEFLLKCFYKNQERNLYPLEEGLIFAANPTVFISLDQISDVTFLRASESDLASRTFDIKIKMLGKAFLFSNFRKQELHLIWHFLHEKNILIQGDIYHYESDDSSDDATFNPSTAA